MDNFITFSYSHRHMDGHRSIELKLTETNMPKHMGIFRLLLLGVTNLVKEEYMHILGLFCSIQNIDMDRLVAIATQYCIKIANKIKLLYKRFSDAAPSFPHEKI